MHLEDVPFVVVDTETTGTRAARDSVIEVAAVKVQGGRIADEFSQLVNPGRTVPRRITKITGITTGMVFDQPPAEDVLPAFVDFLGDGVFVAHNLTFDLGFINAELDRLGGAPLENDTLCTLRLARRLLPGLRSKALGSLIGFYQLHPAGRHRALADASATAEILLRFLHKVRVEYDIGGLDELLTFQYKQYSALRRQPDHVRHVRRNVLPRVPERPGVYFMKGTKGRVLYVGKAKDLRARVRSYFTGIEGHPARIRELVGSVRDVEWEETGSELGALLLESRLIKHHQPPFNRTQRRYRRRPFIRLDTSHEAPRVTWTAHLRDDGAEYYGPLAGRRQAELVVAVIERFYRLRECDDATYEKGRACMYGSMGRCLAPCEEACERDGYATEVQRVRDFLAGNDRSVLDRLQAEMRAASDRMEYERAATYRDWHQKLKRMLERQRHVAVPVLEHHAVIVQPGRRDDTVQLFVVRCGRRVDTLTVRRTFPPEDRTALRESLHRHFEVARNGPERYVKEQVDEMRLLLHWMYVHRDTHRQVRWQPGVDVETLMAQVLEQVRCQP